MKPISSAFKICGLTRPQDVEASIAAGAQMLGFITEAASKRQLSVQQAAQLSGPAKNIAEIVAVTVNPSNALIHEISSVMQPDYIQLHGDETPGRVKEIKELTTVRLIKAVAIARKDDLLSVAAFQDCADYILLDAKPPKEAGSNAPRGGHGKAFEWGLLTGLRSDVPLILAGGIHIGNLGAARRTGLKIFDISSGVESAPGIKDPSLIDQIGKAIRA